MQAIKVAIFFVIYGVACPVYAVMIENQTNQPLVVKIYSGNVLCHETHPIAGNSLFTRDKAPRKCSSAVVKFKGMQGKKVCRVREVNWDTEMLFAREGDKLVCRENNIAGGH